MEHIIVDFVVVVVWGILGIYLIKSEGKGWILLAGYNLATEEQRKKYDEKKLCIYTGKKCLLCTMAFVVGTVIDVFFPGKGFWIGMILTVVVLAHYIYIRFKKFDLMFKKKV